MIIAMMIDYNSMLHGELVVYACDRLAYNEAKSQYYWQLHLLMHNEEVKRGFLKELKWECSDGCLVSHWGTGKEMMTFTMPMESVAL